MNEYYVSNLVPDGDYKVDFETIQVGDSFDLKMRTDKIAKGIVLEKDNYNKLFVKFELDGYNPAYAIVRCQTHYMLTDCHPCIEFDSNGYEWAYKNWNQRKSDRDDESVAKEIANFKKWLEEPLPSHKASSNVSNQWSNYNTKVMGWNGR